MAVFSRFVELPIELQYLIWEAAIPQSPSVHFLSQPRKSYYVAWYLTDQWQSETSNSKTIRAINANKDPKTGTSALTEARYSSYLARLALLHACRDSRRICLAHASATSTNSHDSALSSVVSIHHCTLNLAEDIICIQDPTSRLPWHGLPRLPYLPELSPVRIAFERRPLFDDCNISESPALCDCKGYFTGDWRNETGFLRALGCPKGRPGPKIIYILDYDIEPRYAIVASTPDTDDNEVRPSRGLEQHDSGSLAVKPGHTSTHNGKFHGHGVAFYALSAITKDTSFRWHIPLEVWEFYDNLCAHLRKTYGYKVVHSLREAKEGTDKISVEFLACIRA